VVGETVNAEDMGALKSNKGDSLSFQANRAHNITPFIISGRTRDESRVAKDSGTFFSKQTGSFEQSSIVCLIDPAYRWPILHQLDSALGQLHVNQALQECNTTRLIEPIIRVASFDNLHTVCTEHNTVSSESVHVGIK